MRRVLFSMAVVHALVLGGPAAQAQRYEPALPPGAVYGVGCYWFRGQHYCSRYCWLEIDGYTYCHRRLSEAGSQAPPPVAVVRPPYRHVPPRAPYGSRRSGDPPPKEIRKARTSPQSGG